MSITAHVKQSTVLDGSTAMVTAIITHGSREGVDGKSAAFALQASVDSNLIPIEGSMRVIENTPYRTSVRLAMSAANEVIPFEDGMAGFSSVSSNIYMDSKENIWSLRQNEAGKVLVRSNAIDDASEIGQLLESCSNVTEATANSRDRQFFQSVASAGVLRGINKIDSQDFVSFAHAGKMHNGFVVTALVNDQHQPTGHLSVIAFNDNPDQQPVTIREEAIVQNHGIPGYEEPESMEVSTSSANDLISYYRKIYGHNAQFFRELEKQIRGYAFS